MQQPLVRAVLDRFPGAEIVAVRDVVAEDETVAPRCRTTTPKENSSARSSCATYGRSAIVEAEAFFGCLKCRPIMSSNSRGSMVDVFLEGIEVIERDRARAHVPAMLARGS